MNVPPDSPVVSADICRGTGRLLAVQGWVVLPEMVLANGRRVDLMALSAAGTLLAIEIKVSQADLVGDGKWQDYLAFCDQFAWAVPPHLASLIADVPARCNGAGLILADRYGADWRIPAPDRPTLAGARRKALLLSFARQAALRLQRAADQQALDGVPLSARLP